MNARAKTKSGERVPESRVAADFLAENPFFHQEEEEAADVPDEESVVHLILSHTWQHLFLVAVSLSAAILIALPLGIVAARWSTLSQPILSGVGLIQTIPSLALLAFLVPMLHLGVKPALMALFLYSLLPIVRNTFTGLRDIPQHVRESAEALGLPGFARLRLVELPMASRSILAGIKTSAVINVGTATLGGLIGAGGYGEIIFTGLRLDNNWIILEGTIPAAALALAVQGLFELAERFLVPRGLQIAPEG
jgi:osmoprotectant transport system permease protein